MVLARAARLVRVLTGERAYGVLELFLRPGLLHCSGGPFNGQVQRARLFDELMRCRRWKAIVETGCFRGETTVHFAQRGIPVHSIESNPRYFGFTSTRLLLERWRRLGRTGSLPVSPRLHLGDSRVVLGQLARERWFPRDGVFFYLDAHWYDELPLREEIELVFAHWPDALAMIDDFEVPGTAYGFDDYGDGKRLTMAYLEPLARLRLHRFSPTAPCEAETGARRGCLVLCRDDDLARQLRSVAGLRAYAAPERGGAATC